MLIAICKYILIYKPTRTATCLKEGKKPTCILFVSGNGNIHYCLIKYTHHIHINGHIDNICLSHIICYFRILFKSF